jgi:hypothetical protein
MHWKESTDAKTEITSVLDMLDKDLSILRNAAGNN